MRVWTDGAIHLVARERGIELHRADQPVERHALGEPAKSAWPERDVLAVASRAPLYAWIGRRERVDIVALDGTPRIVGRVGTHVLDAVGLRNGKVLACVRGGAAPQDSDAPEPARLVVLDGAAPDLAAARELTMPPAPRIRWPGGIWDAELTPWPEDDVEEGDPPLALDALAVAYAMRDGGVSFDNVICSANEHGVVVTGAYSGLVAALPPDAGRIDFAVRVPTQVGETEIHAARTAEGVVVVLCVEGRHAAILHIAPDGRVLAHRDTVGKEPAWGLGPPVVHGDRVLVYELGQRGSCRIHDLSLARLDGTKSSAVGASPHGEMSAASGPGGLPLVLGLGNAAFAITRGGRGRLLVAALEPPPPPRPPPARPAAPQRASGPPSLALAGPCEPKIWETTAGGPLTIEIPFTNHGGAGCGVAVEVAGPAVQSGLVRPQQVTVGEDLRADLVLKGGAARAELPAVALTAGYTPVKLPRGTPAPPLAQLVARVEVRGAKPGSAVLTVRLSPLDAPPGRGSVLQGKSLAVNG